MKYRKKPIVIEAVQYRGKITQEMKDFLLHAGNNVTFRVGEMVIDTLEGKMTAKKGDWIIKGVNGELYPIKNEIFQKTYEPIYTNSQDS